eukprot:11052170-Heterocapsa_arctica.AAC.1
MEECREAHFTKAWTDTTSWNVCAGGSVSATWREVVSVAASFEVCRETSSGTETGSTQVVKIPGEPGK